MCNENNSEKNVSAGVARLFAGKSVYLRNESGGACLFAAGFAEGGAVLPVAITILLGMSTVFALDTVLAYGAGMLALWLAADF